MFPTTGLDADERRHEPGPESLWNESWYFDFAARDSSIGGYVRLGLYPNLDTAWYWACVVGSGRPLVAVVDHEVPLPRARSLEVRSSGLWADHNCETPPDHWSLGLEAFGVVLDEPSDAYGDRRGRRVAVGVDLEWEIVGEVFRYPPGLDRYEVPCRVHGEVLVGDERVEVDAVGQRDHSWGVRDWWTQGWVWTAFQLDDGSRWHAVVPEGSPFSIGYVQVPGSEPEGVAQATVAATPGPHGMPVGVELTIGSTDFAVEPIAWAPILLESADGRRSRFPRAMAEVRRTTDGCRGVGWIELNQPVPGSAD
jgi:hypothetical protein